jgi:hypothetical protein
MTTKLIACSECSSFLPAGARACPNCGFESRSLIARLPGPVRGLLLVGGGGLMSVTLSACYGAPCAGTVCDPYDAGPVTCEDSAQDTDLDGYCLAHDCDETDPNRHEGALDTAGDGIDQNCDSVDGVAATDAGM